MFICFYIYAYKILYNESSALKVCRGLLSIDMQATSTRMYLQYICSIIVLVEVKKKGLVDHLQNDGTAFRAVKYAERKFSEA